MRYLSHADEVKESLIRLYSENRSSLGEYPWEFEDDRWTEMVKCIFAGCGIPTPIIDDAVNILDELKLISAPALAESTKDSQKVVQTILMRLGAESVKADSAASVLVNFADIGKKKWNGHIQIFLRDSCIAIVEELSKILGTAGLDKNVAKKMSILWLQNTINAPLIAEDDKHIQSFCKQNHISQSKLVRMADELDLNLAVLDDLLAIKEPGKHSKPKSPRRRKSRI